MINIANIRLSFYVFILIEIHTVVFNINILCWRSESFIHCLGFVFFEALLSEGTAAGQQLYSVTWMKMMDMGSAKTKMQLNLYTPQKLNTYIYIYIYIHTKKDGLENVSVSSHGYFWASICRCFGTLRLWCWEVELNGLASVSPKPMGKVSKNITIVFQVPAQKVFQVSFLRVQMPSQEVFGRVGLYMFEWVFFLGGGWCF